jgi:murein DD-endopeptidase MepM/ murein hydrolase activator NlpD
MLMSHLKEGLLVKAGDIILIGQPLGYIDHTGSASITGHGNHLHASYKLPNKNGYLEGIDFSKYLKK